jgi:hypothetical protein
MSRDLPNPPTGSDACVYHAGCGAAGAPGVAADHCNVRSVKLWRWWTLLESNQWLKYWNHLLDQQVPKTGNSQTHPNTH